MGDVFRLDNRVAVVTGAGRGIGYEIAAAMAAAGATVAVAELDRATGERAVAELTAAGRRALFVPLDVADSGSVASAARTVIDQLGSVDILVNNAGICINASALETTDDIWSRQMAVNLNGVFYCCREFGRHMVEKGSGSIINIASIAGVIDVRPQHHIAYSASKAAVAQIARVLASEWAPHGIRANALAPGYVATDMPLAGGANQGLLDFWRSNIPLGRMIEPSEIAAAAVFLASDAASSVTGHVLMADGGYTAW